MKVLEYFNARYIEEQLRHTDVENKSAKMLTFITCIIGFLTLYAGYAKDELFDVSSYMSLTRIILFILSVFTVICSWGHALSAIKIGDYPTLPRSLEALDYIDNVDEHDREAYIKQCYKDVLGELITVIDEKYRNLTLSYEELVISVYLLSFLSIITAIMEF